ncbi:MAG: YebC/PmpR family DNA-binding transcriptional regulator [Candidatus Aquicultor secundus]|uniref:Probable transcriptional regulatory protein COY37_05495 n=1 Tax=Candidatus Aquicultor secundus TaxID=1973895 RepID=A0A2M7T831_9ACTN|nr:YebC/PmpR family DNA-binding transcriptional regulator [Candidatus Aquicultor secundus]NCO66284.1 YebC/PmpR family DNA-binding transcriptional regulator [Solirubrobacter sp.]OIO87239.1 MAG: transcriptional regulator [Candidatus Aquicultor secundus]PIU26059.1 MAG: YebC/PmpR family DNA-binding transcriptional regulator [Candidatus Aquicultor secundus]PIW21334.1 MAG: YebC/PmpR family DNA-binding transcriptional regulator [Candidatus Aquicultor secundus]PIX52651.1 MAG: YebC/PmpR family DNA-bind
MSGHSKWATIKHKKGKEDAKRGKLFAKLSRAIMVAARNGSNPDMNAALANAIEKARSYSMPADNIDRAIKKGAGELGAVTYEELTYEGFGPAGVAIMVDVMTDNRNRTAADVRHIFTKYGGNLGASGSVGWMFDRKGIVAVDKSHPIGEDELFTLAVEAGAEDMTGEDDQWQITTDPTELNFVRNIIEKHGIPIALAEIAMVPKNPVKLDKEEAMKVLRFVDVLEDNDDVQDVYSNFDIPAEVLEELAGS